MRTATTTQRILELAERTPEGEVLTAKALLHLGARAAVDQALSRLVRRGLLLRVGRGLYARPVRGRFGTRSPQPEKVVAGIRTLTGETITPSGASAANALGLTPQMPIRAVYLTSGRSRNLRLGAQVVELRHAPTWQVRAPEQPAGQAVRALAWLGPEQVEGAAATLRARLTRTEQCALVSARAGMPTWLAEAVSRAFCEESKARA